MSPIQIVHVIRALFMIYLYEQIRALGTIYVAAISVETYKNSIFQTEQ